MDEKQKWLVVGAVGLGAVAVLWLLSRGSTPAVATDGQTNLASLPASTIAAPPLYDLGDLQIPGSPPWNPLNPAAPQGGMLFQLNPQAMIPPIGVSNDNGSSPPIWGGPGTGQHMDGDGCGGSCGCNDVTSSGSNTDAYGGIQALTQGLSPILNWVMKQIPGGVVAPGVQDPGATTNLQAAYDGWHSREQDQFNAANILFSPASYNQLASI